MSSQDMNDGYMENSYALGGKIMLSAIVILFFVVILIVCLHLYARWYLLRVRQRHIRRTNRNRRTRMVFYVDPANPNSTNVNVPARGLDATVLKTLPEFVFSSKTHPNPTDCAVCLSEFQENEKGRNLPNCNHSFHVECIDMWFHSHSTCPLCRSPVEPVAEKPVHVVSISDVADPGSSYDLCPACLEEERPAASTSTFGGRRKPAELVGVTIEVPRRNGNFEDESGTESSTSQFRSPMSRMLSFKRILSRERRASASPSGNAPTCGESLAEFDIERGSEESRQTRC